MKARAHRIGQTKKVKVYRLLTRNTYEAHMFSIASKRLGLNLAILGMCDNEFSLILNSTETTALYVLLFYFDTNNSFLFHHFRKFWFWWWTHH
jgi:hypothetical protein